jgi:hypothetical protein
LRQLLRRSSLMLPLLLPLPWSRNLSWIQWASMGCHPGSNDQIRIRQHANNTRKHRQTTAMFNAS